MSGDYRHDGAITIDPPIPAEELADARLNLGDLTLRVVELSMQEVPGAFRHVAIAIDPALSDMSGYRVTEELQLIVDRFGEGRTFGGHIHVSWSFDGGGQFRHTVQDGRAIQVYPTVTWPTAIARQVLACRMQVNDADAATVGEYLARLLGKVWEENECFDGKRPFGNSGWECEVYVALVQAGLVAGKLNERGRIVDVDERAALQLVATAIRELWFTTGEGGNARR